MRVKIDCWDGEFNCEIYDNSSDPDRAPLFPCADGKHTPMSLITKGCHIACLIKCSGIYFSNGKFGVTWRFVQGVVKPKMTAQSMRGKCQISLTDSELSQLAGEQEEEQTMVDDDLDAVVNAVAEAEMQIEPTPPPASPEKPKPKARRKVVRRKAS